jgi:hypothetical protein
MVEVAFTICSVKTFTFASSFFGRADGRSVVRVSRSSQRWRDQNNDVTADEEHFNGSLGGLAKGTDTG